MKTKNEKLGIMIAGAVIGIIAVLLVLFGNPKNMGYCIACFLRDTAGGLKLHSAAVVQYVRPEIIGLVLGSFIMATLKKEWAPKGGSAPFTRFILGFFVMIGCLAFLGCPFRMTLRLAGGDLNALVGLAGFVVGILCGVFFLNKGYSLKRTYKQPKLEGAVAPAIQVVLLVVLVALPTLLVFSEKGPGSMHAPIIISLIAGLVVGALAQRSRMCMVGGIRDVILFKETKLLSGFVVLFVAALIGNLVLNAVKGGGFFKLGFIGADWVQPVAHTAHIWNFLGMMLVGYGCTLLGGCPLRQLILAGEGNTDSAITVTGLVVGAAFCHNFGLAGSAASITDGVVATGGVGVNGQVMVIVGLIVCTIIGCVNTFGKKD
ncbi:MAG: YedE-related selenium metabolism membrane protein [Oscillospiraceae bacterium]|nr:YedE-related selenium metabolism membrane protein [Oscillospiraceae bacterium]